jgi:hypothetical protein
MTPAAAGWNNDRPAGRRMFGPIAGPRHRRASASGLVPAGGLVRASAPGYHCRPIEASNRGRVARL